MWIDLHLPKTSMIYCRWSNTFHQWRCTFLRNLFFNRFLRISEKYSGICSVYFAYQVAYAIAWLPKKRGCWNCSTKGRRFFGWVL